MTDSYSDFLCSGCDSEKPHKEEFKEDIATTNYVCTVCGTINHTFDHNGFQPDCHVCSSDGVEWCYCDDSKHKHCDECDDKCEYDRSYEC